MPCYGGMLTESTFMSYIKWANTARQLGIDWTVETMTNESLISRARNTLTAKFLANKDSTHLMFIDADIGFKRTVVTGSLPRSPIVAPPAAVPAQTGTVVAGWTPFLERPQLMAIISMAQQASPNVTGQMDERRAHWTIFSTDVVNTGISDSSPIYAPSLPQSSAPLRQT